MTDGKQILVVDDEPLIRVLVRRILGEQGYRIKEAASGDQAIAILKASGSEIDLLLTDMKMPGMHGTELATIARSMLPDLPVLYMSGYSEELSKLQSAEFIEKPFNRNSMLNKIRTAFAAAARETSANSGGRQSSRSAAAEQLVDDTIRKLMRAEWELARRKG